mmetsp:Transcript_10014/g.27694  ORF Transcript_10014/g.27694 Transcript_10014/m.27694 type:complete len:143 (-) Transcript_10014:248-676(-)
MLSTTSRTTARILSNYRWSTAVLQQQHPQQQQVRCLSSVITLSDGEAVEKFRQVKPKSLLYFTAVWCPPCKTIKPVYEEMSTKYSDIGFGKVDVDENPEAAEEFQIQAVPTFVFFNGKDQVNRFSGADPNQLEGLVKDLQSR